MISRNRFRNALIAALPVLVSGALMSSEASACGGFFCSSSPVDQTAEHIIFTINGDHTVTAYVQIKYVGDKDDFAWIVPAPGIPKLSSEVPDLAMQGLDIATQPQYFESSCNRYAFPVAGAGGSAATAAPTPVADAGVTVLAQQAVGPFQTVTLEGTSADVLIKWLNDNGYRITDKMAPLIQPYVEGGMHFVAMKLQADKNTTDITPIGMTYDSDQPLIPIRLTSVAAQPEMGIVAFVFADRRWAPQNYIDLKIDDSLIRFDQYGYANNYLSLVSSESDKVGGQAFVTEYAQPTAMLADQIQNQFVNTSIPDAVKSQQALLGLFQKFPYMTRLYARMSAEEMTADPVFMVSSKTADVSNMHDLTDPNFDQSKCTYGTTQPPLPPPCEFAYCGRRGACVQVDAPLPYSTDPNQTTPTAACVCANDATGRLTTTGATPAVYCEPVSADLDATPDAGVTTSPGCEGYDCGAHGACVTMNGNPTCQCEAGYAAYAKSTYDQTTGQNSVSVNCLVSPIAAPALPVLPPVGQTTIPRGIAGATGAGGSVKSNPPSTSAGGSGAGGTGNGTPTNGAAPEMDSGGGGCGVAQGSSTSSATGVLFALSALAVSRRRRARSAAKAGSA
ncbi:MAG TPA: DUF2330 domain-containing protein [Polyangiaceae bacterium]|jgi:hypothetical protein|nr:DUF2330 domain-containing protein [Polyangiaceae bacterium]